MADSIVCNYEMQVLEVHVRSLPLIDSWAQIVGCRSGLLCVKRDYIDTFLPSFLVCNPATREVRQVPKPNLDGDVYDLGFGFSPIVNDYKIVMSHETQVDFGDSGVSNYRIAKAEVYSLSKGSWKEIEVLDVADLSLDRFPVTSNGAIFWYGNKLGGII